LSFSFMAIGNSNDYLAKRESVAGYARLYHLSNSLIAYWTQSYVPKDFDPSTGFVSRKDVIATTPGFYIRRNHWWMPKFVRFSEPGVYLEIYHKASTRELQESSFNFNPVFLSLQSGGYIGYLVNFYHQNLDAPFLPLNISIAPGSYDYVRHHFAYASDPSQKISAEFHYELGNYYDGNLTLSTVRVRTAPTPHASFTFAFENNEFRKVGENSESRSVSLYSVESRLALNPRLQLISFYQKNTSGNRDTWNIRFAWEFKPLSFVYLVFNQRAFSTTERQSEQHFIGKISYLKQF
jgi:hypothetical protein